MIKHITQPALKSFKQQNPVYDNIQFTQTRSNINLPLPNFFNTKIDKVVTIVLHPSIANENHRRPTCSPEYSITTKLSTICMPSQRSITNEHIRRLYLWDILSTLKNVSQPFQQFVNQHININTQRAHIGAKNHNRESSSLALIVPLAKYKNKCKIKIEIALIPKYLRLFSSYLLKQIS